MGPQLGAIILGTSLVQLALGFFATFTSLRIRVAGFDDISAGLVLSSYFAGFAIGAVWCGGIIERIGYIRTYAGLAGCVAASIAIMPLWVAAIPWIVLRGIIGFGCAGLFVATESWLNAKAPPALRGQIFSIYMVGTFVALALGQLLIIRADVAATGPFNVLTALFAFAVVIVSMTRAEAPLMTSERALAYGELLRAAPLAVAAAVVAGIVASAFYSLVPLWMQEVEISQANIGIIMLAAVLGGLAFQIPIGWLSDVLDRRLALALVAFGLALAASMTVLVPRTLATVLPVSFILGGFMSTVYPVGVAHAHDRMSGDRVVSVSSRLILLNGIGAIFGPLVGTVMMRRYAVDGVFYLIGLSAAFLAAVAFIGRLRSSADRHKDRPFFIVDPQAAPLGVDPKPSTAPALSVRRQAVRTKS
ncbi:MFS transporter [Labrys miyagiensis]|uniref:MFS transporter n=1 Tax=Labrys miyagiensis TaxID=346912 RepID=A0ABQ6CIG4_9HYPH|nr:MFS transporter [Labrys miyagiensis]GLS18509.1 MFS transporter [Labrys miyagiensis]